MIQLLIELSALCKARILAFIFGISSITEFVDMHIDEYVCMRDSWRAVSMIYTCLHTSLHAGLRERTAVEKSVSR